MTLTDIARTSRAGALDLVLRCLAFMAAVAHLAVSRTVIATKWDDAFFLDRAACVNRAFYGKSLAGLDHCLSGMLKSPILSLLLLPAGPLNGQIDQLGVATFLLAFATFGLAIWLGWLTLKARIPLPAILAAALAIGRCGAIRASQAPFLVDGAFAVLVAVAMLLPILEHAAPTASASHAVSRGALWGGIATLGALSKVTFGFFGVLAAPMMLLASFRKSGPRPTAYKTIAAVAVCLIPAFMFLRYGSMYLSDGWRSAYGDLAQYYAGDLSYWAYVRQTVTRVGPLYWIVCAGLLAFATMTARRDSLRFGLGLAVAGVAVLYLLLASHSPNRPPRFIWPVWIVLPVALASCIAPREGGKDMAGARPIALALSIAALWSLPMMARFDFQNVREAAALLRFLKTDHAVRLEVASDPPHFNINTLALAQQVQWGQLWTVDIRTVVYDLTYDQSPAYSDQQLRTANFVLITWPITVPPAPEFTNRFASQFLAVTRKCGRLISGHPGPADTMLFDMRGCQVARPSTAQK